MPFYRRRRNVNKRKTGRKFPAKKSSKVSAPVKSYVNRLIRRNEETKFVSNSYTLTSFNAGIGVSADFLALLPPVTQGTAQSQRIGNKVRPTKLVIRGYVIYNADAGSAKQDARMIGGRLFCFQDKATRSYSNNVLNYHLLDNGGTSENFVGTPINWCTPHNSDQFTWYADKKMKFLKPFGYTNNTTPTTSNAITGMDSSLFHPFTITLTAKQLPAVLLYDQTDSVSYPTNFAPYLALGYCDFFNGSPDTTTTQLAMQFNATLYFKDA